MLTAVSVASHGVGRLCERDNLIMQGVANGRVDCQVIADVLRLVEPACRQAGTALFLAGVLVHVQETVLALP